MISPTQLDNWDAISLHEKHFCMSAGNTTQKQFERKGKFCICGKRVSVHCGSDCPALWASLFPLRSHGVRWTRGSVDQRPSPTSESTTTKNHCDTGCQESLFSMGPTCQQDTDRRGSKQELKTFTDGKKSDVNGLLNPNWCSSDALLLRPGANQYLP